MEFDRGNDSRFLLGEGVNLAGYACAGKM